MLRRPVFYILLQLDVASGKRLTHGTVAHAHWLSFTDPPVPCEIPLQEWCAVSLLGIGSLVGNLPSFISVPSPASRATVFIELRSFGHTDVTIALAQNTTMAVCLPPDCGHKQT